MKKNTKAAKFLLLSLLSAVISALFQCFGAPFVRVTRIVYGAKAFWIAGVVYAALLSFVSPLFGCMVAGIWMSVGFYTEFEFRGRTSFTYALLSTVMSLTLSLILPVVIMNSMGGSVLEAMDITKQSLIDTIKTTMNGNTSFYLGPISIDLQNIVYLLPSLIFVVYAYSIAFALIFGQRTAVMMNEKVTKIASGLRLLDFKLPDYMIWVAMISFLLSFYTLKNQFITYTALNIFNISLSIYLLQGIAILEVLLLVFRAGFFLRMFVYVFIVGQLFFLFGFVGIVDYWVDFRRRLKKRMTN